jgi:hypothetical protein
LLFLRAAVLETNRGLNSVGMGVTCSTLGGR